MDSWFIKIPAVRDRMVELKEEQINWKPKFTGEGRFANWLAEAKDWNLSRSRFWGIPLPIWRTEDSKEEKIIGSIAELKEEIRKSVEAGFMEKDPYASFTPGNMSEENYDSIDLHKPYVDHIVWVSDSGKTHVSENELIDVWFDSGFHCRTAPMALSV